MKVKLQDIYKDIYTVSDLDRARAVIRMMREDCASVQEYAECAVREALTGKDDYIGKDAILRATATTAKNSRVWDGFYCGSYDMDVWIEATAETAYGFVKVGAYLTDIWTAGAESFREHMWVNYYEKVE